MNTPAFLLGAAMIFRGSLIGPLALAVAVGFVLEAHRFIPWRIEISRKQFGIVWNVCVSLFVGMAAFFVVTEPSKAVGATIRWAPIAMLPMMAAIAYSSAGKVDLDILSVISRYKVRREGEAGRKAVALDYPFLLLCVLSASAASERPAWFYAGAVVFVAWTLWSVRSRSVSFFSWLTLIVLCGVLGYAGHVGLHALHGMAEQVFTDWYAGDRSDEGYLDPKHCSIGSVGSRKLSNRILLRVELPDRPAAPLLLREAVYATYRAELWSSGYAAELSVQPVGNGTWRLGADGSAGRAMTIHATLGEGEKVLPLPLDAARIEGLPAAALSRSRLGTVKVKDGAAMADYRVFSDSGSLTLEQPTDRDVAIPESEAAVLRTMAAGLGLNSAEPEKAMESLAGFFKDRFAYSLVRAGDRGAMALSEFLLSKRAGHCEYFATATVLLLRAAGIPARYAVGYSVQEYSDLEKMFVARARHAHAWCLVYVNGAWRDFDTTPPSWADMDNTGLPMISYVHDLWQRAVFLFSQWRRGPGIAGFRSFSIWGLGAAAIFIARWIFKKRKRRDHTGSDGFKEQRSPGSDSEFYAVEKVLTARGFLRQPWESTSAWLEKIERQQGFSREQCNQLAALIALHNRYRFDPKGITPEERETLRATARSWLDAEQENERLKKH